MDNLAHTLAGAALGEAGLKKRTALGMATLLIGANLPDVDVLAIPLGVELDFRRGWTHGLLALVVLPFVLTMAIVAWDRWVRRRRAADLRPVNPRQLLYLSFVSIASHPLLDWLNTYGMRWLMPFDRTWFYGDTLFIVDPWLWLILLGGVIAAREGWGAPGGRLGLAAASFYVAAMLLSTGAAREMVHDGLREEGMEVDEVMVGPVPANPIRRDVVMRRGDLYYRGTLRWLPRPQLVVDEKVVRANTRHPAARLAAAAPAGAEFLRWARFPVFTIEPLAYGYRVVLDDLRYTDGKQPSWAAVELIVGTQRPPSGQLTGEIETIVQPRS